VDGEGTLITTESVLLNPNRNPGISKAEFEACFARLLGISKTIWLPGDPQYVTGDMTDGHVDGVCAFARPGVLLVDATHDKGSVYAEVVRENRRALELATDAQGRHFELLDLYEASAAVDTDAEVFCASYTNFYIANGAIIMPAYGIDADQAAAAQLAHAFPGREVVPVRIDHRPRRRRHPLHHPAAAGWVQAMSPCASPPPRCPAAGTCPATSTAPSNWCARPLPMAPR
jgi:agmatine deiminase